MTEIMPVPRNLNFTVLPAESYCAAFFVGNIASQKHIASRVTRGSESFAGLPCHHGKNKRDGSTSCRLSLCSCETKRTAGTYLVRALLASAISWKMPACFFAMIARMTSRVATISAQAMMRQMTTFWMIPARMKLTKATPDTVSA